MMVNNRSRTSKCRSTREIQDLIPRFGFTKNPTSSLRGSQTITKMGNTNFPRLTTPSGSSRATSNHPGARL
jgi:hypothetical protein